MGLLGSGSRMTFPALMATASLDSRIAEPIRGKNANTAQTRSLVLVTAGTYYVFSFTGQDCSFNKVVFDGSAWTFTTLKNTSNSYGNIGHSSNAPANVYYSNAPETLELSAYTPNGLTLAALAFDGYTEAEIDQILQSVTLTGLAGSRSSAAAITINASSLAPLYALVFANTILAFDSIKSTTADAIFTTSSSNSSYLYYDGDNASFSTNGTSAATSYRGGIIQVS